MQKIKIYFDNCCLQRPLDDKSQIRNRIEAELVLYIMELIENGKVSLVTSSLVEYELNKTSDIERISFGKKVLSLHSERILLSDEMVLRAKEFEKRNIKPIDSLHLAIADIKKLIIFSTCDDKFLKNAIKITRLNTIIITPIKFIQEYETWER